MNCFRNVLRWCDFLLQTFNEPAYTSETSSTLWDGVDVIYCTDFLTVEKG